MKKALLVVGFVILSACGVKNADNFAAVQGTWVSRTCYYDSASNLYGASVYVISGDQITEKYTGFNDIGCSDANHDLSSRNSTLRKANATIVFTSLGRDFTLTPAADGKTLSSASSVSTEIFDKK